MSISVTAAHLSATLSVKIKHFQYYDAYSGIWISFSFDSGEKPHKIPSIIKIRLTQILCDWSTQSSASHSFLQIPAVR